MYMHFVILYCYLIPAHYLFKYLKNVLYWFVMDIAVSRHKLFIIENMIYQ